ncbi:MAG: ABC-type multidrug transport system, ATPase component [uncultured Thiotrichaceae bacterium]|uniref:ABC-type multidrug transport system, ATPase component n=1 Tax=uncultured Thiotrichaceae bacterium TaxID=298394 RepID=A0A6S6T4R8_9GAMM|nr:MAG: ABC-type multidrug transport system, ATPase component [uncultured Thiotrichaceae bacterium]
MSKQFLIQARNLHRHYDTYHAVNAVNIQLKQGEVLGLLGPNGAGKSTTMNMLTGNLAPGSGEILINHIDLLDNPKRAKEQLGYLPEQPPVYKDMTVTEYLRYCAILRHIPKKDLTKSIDRALQRCSLTEVRKRLIGNLSKGFQQRVGIAQAIIHNPLVVILDEPTVGLDPVQIQEIRHLIRELGDEHSVILSTHILPEVQAVCDRVQIINKGQTVYENTLDQISHSISHMNYEIGFTHPIDTALLNALDIIKNMSELSNNRYQLEIAGDQHSVSEIAAFALQNQWQLIEITPKKVSLESIFLDLVHVKENAA